MKNIITNNYDLKRFVNKDILLTGVILGFIYVSQFIVILFYNNQSSSVVYVKYIFLCIYLVFAFNSFGKTSYKNLLGLSFKLSLVGGITYVIFYLFFTQIIDENYEKTLFNQFINHSFQTGHDIEEMTKLINSFIKYKVVLLFLYFQVIVQTFFISLIVSFFYSKGDK